MSPSISEHWNPIGEVSFVVKLRGLISNSGIMSFFSTQIQLERLLKDRIGFLDILIFASEIL